MKPTAAMFHRLRARPGAPDAGAARPRPAVERPAVTSRRTEAEPPERRRDARGPGGEVADALADVALATATPAAPGHVAVRVTGLGEDGVRLPLGGLRARASAGDHRVEGTTDERGFVLLCLGVESSFDVDVLSPAGEVVGRATSRVPQGRSVAIEVSVVRRPELEDAFARGRAWLESLQRRAEQLDASRNADVRALEQRVAALEATVAQLTGRQQTLARDQARPQGAKPKEPGASPKEPGASPKEPGASPKEPGASPKEPVDTTDGGDHG